MNFTEDQDKQIQKLVYKEIISFISSPIYLVLVGCILSLASFIVINSYQTLEKVSDSVSRLEMSITLLNHSLSVIDERTRNNEEMVIEVYKKTKRH